MIDIYACYLADDNIRMDSSSGAIFSVIATYVLSNKGIVYGVKMTDDNYSAIFTAVTSEDGLPSLRGSKYVQAQVGTTFKRVQEDLREGRLVLFTGTACQINGLRKFLGKEYRRLICVDVLCHGVPSPMLWRKYVEELEEKNDAKLIYVNFRNKDQSWEDFGMKKVMRSINSDRCSVKYISRKRDPYMRLFLSNYSLRPSCYRCMAKKEDLADITIGDFWGISDVAPEMNNHKGVSCVFVRTELGRSVFDEVSKQLTYKEVAYDNAVAHNPVEHSSVNRPGRRDDFYANVSKMSLDDLVKYYLPSNTTFDKIKVKIKTLFKIGGDDYYLLFLFDGQTASRITD